MTDTPETVTPVTRSRSFSFSLQILTHEGFSIKGDMHMTSPVPQRKSREFAPALIEEEEYDDTPLGLAPVARALYRPASQAAATTRTMTHALTARPTINAAPASHRITGRNRAILWCLFVACAVFLVNGVVFPIFGGISDQLKYGDARIATFDVQAHHWITEEDNGLVRIVVSAPDGSHSQVLTTQVAGAPPHALVILKAAGDRLDVSINGTHALYLVSDGKGGYVWSVR